MKLLRMKPITETPVDVQVTRPLPHRPGVMVVQCADARLAVLSDGGTFTPEEIEMIYGAARPARSLPPLQYTEIESADLAMAEQRLADAIEAEAGVNGEIDRLRAEIEQAKEPSRAALVARLQGDVRQQYEAAREAHKSALRGRNRVQRRVTNAAAARRARELHKR